MKLFSKSYFDEDISRGFMALFASKITVMTATALLGIFLPIFLYNLFDKNFQYVIIYYGLGYFLYALFVGLGVKFLNFFGFRNALKLSTFIGALYYLIFYFLDKDNLYYLIPFAIIVLVFYRILYWTPYHVDFAKFTGKKDKAEEFSLVEATRNLLSIFIPVIAGLVITRFSFNVLFVVAMVLYLASFIPYLVIPKTEEEFSWSYLRTWREFFSRKRRKTILAFSAYGAEETVGFLVWPIFIYQILNGNYFQVGLVSTLIISVTVILQLSVGKYITGYSREKRVLKIGSFLYAIGWIFKVFVATAFHIFIIGSYHNLMRIFLNTPFQTLTYEIAADEGHYVDEFTVIHEMAVSFGKFLMALLIIFISLFFEIQWTFVLAATVSLAFNLLQARKGKVFLR